MWGTEKEAFDGTLDTGGVMHYTRSFRLGSPMHEHRVFDECSRVFIIMHHAAGVESPVKGFRRLPLAA